jgi:hypothetical protein
MRASDRHWSESVIGGALSRILRNPPVGGRSTLMCKPETTLGNRIGATFLCASSHWETTFEVGMQPARIVAITAFAEEAYRS